MNKVICSAKGPVVALAALHWQRNSNLRLVVDVGSGRDENYRVIEVNAVNQQLNKMRGR